jgi:uncharacterized metal-binding protein YceD (DUF177 family)
LALPLVHNDAVPNSGLDVVVGAWAKDAVSAAFGESTYAGTLRVMRKGPHLIVTGDLTLSCTVSCDRCTMPIPLNLAPHVACVYSPIAKVPERTEDDGAAGPAFPPDLPVAVEDAGEYDGVALDLADVVVESFEVERPARWLCLDAFPDDAKADRACAARWRALSGASEIAAPSPFAALAGWKPAES